MFISAFVSAQNFIYISHNIIGSYDVNETVNKVLVDANNNTYLAGSFFGTVDFDPSSGTTNLTSNGGNDLFLAKYNSAGALQWAFNIGGGLYGSSGIQIDDAILDAALDNNGDIIIGGYYSGNRSGNIQSIDFDPGISATYLASSFNRSGFVAKYTSAGTFVWANNILSGNTAGNSSVVNSVAVGGINNLVWIAGNLTGTAGGWSSAGQNDFFMRRYTLTGSMQFQRQVGGAGDERANSITFDNSNNAYVTGSFSGSNVDFGGGTISSSGGGSQFDAYLAKYDVNLNYVMVDMLPNLSSATIGKKVLVNSSNDIFVLTEPSSVGNRLSLNKYSTLSAPFFTFQTAQTFTSTVFTSASDMIFDANNNILLAGNYSGNYNVSVPTNTSVLSSTSQNFFVSLYNTNFSHIKSVSSVTGTSNNVMVNSISSTNGLTIAGRVSTSTVNISFPPASPVTITSNLTIPNTYDLFYAKYTFCNLSDAMPNNTTPSINQSVCSGNTATITSNSADTKWYASTTSTTSLLSGNSFTTASLTNTMSTPTTYSIYAAVENTCVVSGKALFTVTVNPLPTISITSSSNITCVGEVTTFTASGANSYVWNNANTNPILTQTLTNTTTLSVSGIDNNNCSNTATITQSVSLCTGIENIDEAITILIIPNPASNYIQLKGSKKLGIISITDVLNKTVYATYCDENDLTIDASSLQIGIYFITVNSVTKKIIKE